ncbi:hypothetical protein ACA910_012727 [Epithemia clementina (nom. ined.)]
MKKFLQGNSCYHVGTAILLYLALSAFTKADEATASSLRHHSHLRSDATGLFRPRELAECSKDCCDELFQPPPCEDDAPSDNPFTQTPLAIQIILIFALLFMSAFFSGLTLGLMSLDKTGLEIVMEGDDAKYAEYARRIYPLRKRGNLLLCTLLFGNVCVNSLLSILTADKFGGAVGLVSSTFLIVIFGEIVPQALCQRYSLEVGSACVPVVRVIMVVLFPVSFPLAYALDFALGEELATTYSNAEMLKLLQIHVQEKKIDPETAIAMQGALKYKSTTVKEVMTPLENTFMLSSDEQLNFETIAKIFKTGYSRIPVFNIDKNNVIGLLFVKDLIFIDPEDNTRVSDFVDIFGRGLHVVWPDDSLGDVLRELKSGKSHMALVRDVRNEDGLDPFYEVRGIITLEDIIEEIIGDEIVDETDAFVENSNSVPVDRAEGFKWASLRLLDSKIVDERLSYEETKAVTAHLSKNFHEIFSLITETQLQRLIGGTPVSVFPTAEHHVGEAVPEDLLYKRHVENDVCTLVLSGKLTVLAGTDSFRSTVSSWALLGGAALVHSPYKPDFSAWVSAGPCRCLRITRKMFVTAMDASVLERKHLGGMG